MKTVFVTILLSGLLGAVTASADCSYCERLRKLDEGFAKTKPDPSNRETADAQFKLIDEAIAIGEDVLTQKGKSLSKDDVERLTTLMAKTIPYDNANTMTEVLLDPIKPHWAKFKVEILRQKENKSIDASAANELLEAFRITEGVRKHGNDPQDEKAPAKTEKK